MAINVEVLPSFHMVLCHMASQLLLCFFFKKKINPDRGLILGSRSQRKEKTSNLIFNRIIVLGMELHGNMSTNFDNQTIFLS